MSQKLDINKPVKEIIVDKFNAINGIHLEYEHVELGLVNDLLNPTDAEDSRIEIVPTTVAPFLNKFYLRYKKINLADVFGVPYLLIPSIGYITLYELLIEVNKATGLNITSDDVEDAPVELDTSVPGSYPKVRIKTKPTSVLYRGDVVVDLDVTLNQTTETIKANTMIFALNKTDTLDFVTAHSFDGYKVSTFKFLGNVDLITSCKINKLFTCETSLLILTGEFLFVSSKVDFIDPVITYKTIVIDRTGNVVSAKEELSLLDQVPQENISFDHIKKVFYITDPTDILSINPKKVYRLSQSGVLDNNFDTVNLPDNIIRIFPSKHGFFTLNKEALEYKIRRFQDDGQEDTDFAMVKFHSATSEFTKISGYSTVDENDKENLALCLYCFPCNSANAVVFTANEVQSVITQNPLDFYSPFATIENDGAKVVASGFLASLNDPSALDSSAWNYKLVRNITGGSVVYSLNSFNTLKYKTITPLLIGEDKEYTIKLADKTIAEHITNIKKVIQTSSGYETFVLVDYLEKASNLPSSAILSFSSNHSYNGLLVTKIGTDTTITDLAILSY